MPHDSLELKQLQQSALELSYKAILGDDEAFEEFCRTAEVLQSYGLKAPRVSVRSVEADDLRRDIVRT